MTKVVERKSKKEPKFLLAAHAIQNVTLRHGINQLGRTCQKCDNYLGLKRKSKAASKSFVSKGDYEEDVQK